MALKHLRNPVFIQPNAFKLVGRLIHNISPNSQDDTEFSSLFRESKPSPQQIITIERGFSKPLYSDLVERLSTIFSKGKNDISEQELNNLVEEGVQFTTGDVELVLNKQRDWRNGHNFFRWASLQNGYEHNCYTYNAMASILAKNNQTEALKDLVQEIMKVRCRMTSGALGYLVRCLGSVDLVDEALDLFDEAETLKCAPNIYTYNCLLEVLAKSKRYYMAERRYDEMRKNGLLPDEFTYSALLRAYCGAGKLQESLNIFDIMLDHGWVDEYASSILLVTVSKSGMVDVAFELIERMRKCNINPNEKTYFGLVHGFVKGNQVLKALELVRYMRALDIRLDMVTYRVLIEGLCEINECLKAHDLYLEMRKSGLYHLDVHRKLICCLIGDGQVDAVYGLLEDELSFEGVSLVTLCNAVLKEFVKAGKVDEAYSLVQQMIKSHGSTTEIPVNEFAKVEEGPVKFSKVVCPNTASFSLVIDGLCKVGKPDMALGLLDDMAGLNIIPKVRIFNTLIHTLCSLDRLDESHKLLGKMKERGIYPTQYTYNSILGCLCKTEKVSEVLDLMREMRLHGHVPWIKHYTLLVERLCHHGKIIESYDFLNKMGDLGFLPDMIAYTAAIDGYCKSGEMDHALKVFKEMSEKLYIPDVVAYNVLINGFCKVGKIECAQETLTEMLEKEIVPSVATYNSMINGLCKNDQVDLALLYPSKMVSEGRPPNVVTYTTLVDGLFKVGRVNEGLSLWMEMEQKGCQPNIHAYTALIQGLCMCNRAKLGLNYLHKMKSKGIDPETFIYNVLINGLIEEDEIVLACEVLDMMVHNINNHNLTDKNYQFLMQVLRKMSKDERSAAVVSTIIGKGWLPTVHNLNELEKAAKEENI